MKPQAIVAALAALTPEQVSALVSASSSTREAQQALAAFSPPKKRRGRKPGVRKVATAKASPAPAKKAAQTKGKKSKKSSIPDSFTE